MKCGNDLVGSWAIYRLACPFNVGARAAASDKSPSYLQDHQAFKF
jgi:hypothetical protein